MLVESFLATALPVSADPAHHVHVSLFLAHRLAPDGPAESAAGELGDFPVVADWTARLAGSQVRLIAHRAGASAVDVPVRVHTDPLRPELWRDLFPRRLAVRPWQVPDYTAVPWRTFPAHRMQEHALLVHALSLYSSPVSAPRPSGNLVTHAVLDALGLGPLGRQRIADLLGPERDERLSRMLDDLTYEGGFVSDEENREEPSGKRGTWTLDEAVRQVVEDAHVARRFYQRAEQQHPYAETPSAGARPRPVRLPEQEFHSRLGLLSDLSPLLRALGVVLDLEVLDLSALEGVTALQAEVLLPEILGPVPEQPRTACSVAGTAFAATSSSGEWSHGLLRLGDEQSFRVLDLDPDAAGLKLEQYVRTVPRLAATENNGDRVSGAPPTLLGTGFALSRTDQGSALRRRVREAVEDDEALRDGTAAPLELEQVTRGLRLEVWDDTSGAWHSLHRRRLDITAAGERVLVNALDEGFVARSVLTTSGDAPGAPRNAHEVFAGWDGWSLSVTRPGSTVVHEAGKEVVHEELPKQAGAHPVETRTRVERGSLPRLRYGRSYSFRAAAVDLAGNSPGRPGGLPGADEPDPVVVADAPTAPADDDREPVAAVRSLAAAADRRDDGIRTRLAALQQPATARRADADAAGWRATARTDVERAVLSRTAARSQPVRLARRRAELVESAFRRATSETPHLLESTPSSVPRSVERRVATSLRAWPPLTAAAPSADEAVAAAADLVTPPRPFLRWAPVLEPVVVPRAPYTEGESLLRLVVRSGVTVTGDAGSGGISVVAPDVYAEQVRAEHPGLETVWREDAQRHLAPPGTSQLTAELHGCFDALLDGTPTGLRRSLAVALRESGTFLDTTVADLDVPGARLPQPEVQLHKAPTADDPPRTAAGDVERGEGLSPGQYVVHDVEDLVVPHLPDPAADGISLVFPDALPGTSTSGLLAVEGLTLRYGGKWPERTPYRLVLRSGPQLHGEVVGRELRISLPPGEQLRMRLSSSVAPAALDVLGLWRSLPASLRENPTLREAALDGWLWWLTPATEVVLVHAVPRPVQVPRITVLRTSRRVGDTAAVLHGAVDLHGPSTERLDVEASWSEWQDDPAKPGPEQRSVSAVAAGSEVGATEDVAVLGEEDGDLLVQGAEPVRVHAAVHQLGDTRHRDVDYRVRASTRYREFFPPQLLATPDDMSVVSAPMRVSVPSSARPAKVAVREVLPMFRWSERTGPHQPFALQRTRRAGLRLYLDRPWYSTGDGELLAVLLSARSRHPRRAGLAESVSAWAGDPAWLQEGPADAAVLPLLDLLHVLGVDDTPDPGRPATTPVRLPLVDLPGGPDALVLGYQPEYRPERRLWAVDVALDPGAAFWPFVRLAVARYQPDSLAGLHLGPVTTCDFAQLPPERTTTLSRVDERHVRVVVTGPVGVPQTARTEVRELLPELVERTRTVRARLEQADPAVPTDLGWSILSTATLPLSDLSGAVATWSAQIALPADAALPPVRRPGDDTGLRVVVEEEERLVADPSPRGQARTSSRICYADALQL